MTDGAGSTATGPRHFAIPLTLAAIAALSILLRIPSIAEPLGIDQSLWASAVRGMDRGQLLYRDVWEQRPPGIYWAYLTAFRLLGWHAATVAWLDIAAAALTTALIYGIARALSDRLTAALAAALYASMTMPAWLYGNGGFLERAVSETFIVACVCAAMWCAARWRHRPGNLRAASVGLLAGTLLIFKPNAGIYFPAALAWMWLYAPRPLAGRELGRFAMAAVLASMLVPALAVVWLWRLDLLGDAKTAVVDFNRYYVGEGFSPAAYAITFSKAVWLRMKTEPLWTAGTAGGLLALVTLARARRMDPLPALATIWGTACVCVIVVNGARLYNSYFIQALPPLALMGGWFIALTLGGSARARVMGWSLVAVMVGLLAQRDYAGRVLRTFRTDLAVLTGKVDRRDYLLNFGGYNDGRGYSARANEELGEYIAAHTAFDDRIFLFGINGAGVYFDSDRLTAHRFLRVNFFVETEFPDPSFRLDAVLQDLEAAAPKYLIFETLHRSAVPSMQQFVDALPQHPHVRHLLRNYRLETVIEDFALYRRAD
jgi:4-amino-4-deoxy-L-arabinose transferase-like glycosyltransferase